MKKHETAQEIDDYWLNNDWRDEVEIGNKYIEHFCDFLNFLAELAVMWNGHLGSVATAKYRV